MSCSHHSFRTTCNLASLPDAVQQRPLSSLLRQFSSIAAEAFPCLLPIWTRVSVLTEFGMMDFYRLAEHLSTNSWLLVVHWYRSLTARIAFRGAISENFPVPRRQGAILSPSFVNVFLRPLLAVLDETGYGAYLYQHHVPAVCYAHDLFLLSANTMRLGELLVQVGDFARKWRLEFGHPDLEKNEEPLCYF